MTTIEKVANKSFFVGLLAVMLEYKVNSFEEDKDGLKRSLKNLDNIHGHLALLKETSSLNYIQFVYLYVINHAIADEITTSLVIELLEGYDFYRQVKLLKKGYIYFNLA
jgi:hypothetical protein